MKKWLKRLAYTLGIIYLALCVALYFGQERLLFHPRIHDAAYSYGSYPEEWVGDAPGDRLHALHLRARPNRNAEKVVLYLHGNVGDNGRGLYQTKQLQDLGYDMYLVDYPGFGKSERQLNDESDLTEAMQAAYDRLKKSYGESNIILLGYSLGSGPVSYLMANNEPAGAVLVAPYRSLTAMKNLWFWMFPDFLLKYELNNQANLAEATSPTILLHGTEDPLIPYAMSEELRAVAPERIELKKLKGVTHRGAIFRPEVKAAVRQLATR